MTSLNIFEEARESMSESKKVFFILIHTEKSLNPMDFESFLSNLIFKNNCNLNFCSEIAALFSSKKKKIEWILFDLTLKTI